MICKLESSLISTDTEDIDNKGKSKKIWTQNLTFASQTIVIRRILHYHRHLVVAHLKLML